MTDVWTVYFHGAPGAPGELEALGPPGLTWAAPDRFFDRPTLSFSAYLDALAGDLDARSAGAPIHLVGFSAGTRVALEIAGRLKGRIGRIELIAPVAPLDLGDFLPRMEGRALFTLARDRPGLLPLATWTMARIGEAVPRRLFDLVFAHPAGADAALVADPAFVAAAIAGLRRSQGAGSAGYHREILACMRPWGVDLASLDAPIRLWQGSADNWTPPDMAEALAARLPTAESVRRLEGLSHYSTLRHALTEIAAGR